MHFLPFSKSLKVCAMLGVLFSGYLSGVKFFSGTCAFNESCPYFLGYPACYVGFALFLLIFINVFIYTRTSYAGHGLRAILILSILGILFAGYFSFLELPVLLKDGIQVYVLGLPTCVLGFLFFSIIFILALASSIYRTRFLKLSEL